MKQPAMALHVRFRSKLPFEEMLRVLEERAPDFAALDGLIHKYYLHDPQTNEVAGFYLWESPEALAAYSKSELRASIAKAYQADGEPRIEAYQVIRSLR
ncbi:MAG: YdhR family protein [Planctomycetota bacterium]